MDTFNRWAMRLLALFAAIGMLVSEASKTPWGLAATYAAAAAAIRLGRRIGRLRIRRVMKQVSMEAEDAPLPELDAPEVLARTQPDLALYSTDARAAGAEEAHRESYLAQRAVHRDRLAHEAVAALSFAVVGAFVDPTSSLIGVGMLFLAATSYKARVASTHRGLARGVGETLTALLFVTGTDEAQHSLFYFILIGSLAIYSLLFSFVFAIPAVLYVLLVYRAHRRATARQERNVRLLILRVFGKAENAVFTFRQLAARWRDLGNVFTVVDGSFLYHDERMSVVAEMTALAGFGVFGAGISYVSPVHAACYLAILVLVILAYYWWRYRARTRSFIDSRRALLEQLAKLSAAPRDVSQMFRRLPVVCYANTWKMAVSEFAKRSDVVLMDLRGFSEARKGCTYEVDYLFDTVPIAHIVFVVDNETDRNLVERLIFERWKELRTTSPNLRVEAPRAQIFVSDTGNDEDVTALLQTLLAVAKTPRAPRAEGGDPLPVEPATIAATGR